MAFVGALIGAGSSILGGLLGKKSKPSAQTTEVTPWGPAQDWMKQNIATGQQLQNHYQQNPFNATQRQAYQGLLGDVDHMRQSVAPGLMNMANNMTTGSYQRPQYSSPGQAGYGGTPAQDQTPGGLLATGNNRPGPFSVAQQPEFGQIDWNASNPHFKTPEQIAEEQRLAAAAAQAAQSTALTPLQQAEKDQREADLWARYNQGY